MPSGVWMSMCILKVGSGSFWLKGKPGNFILNVFKITFVFCLLSLNRLIKQSINRFFSMYFLYVGFIYLNFYFILDSS